MTRTVPRTMQETKVIQNRSGTGTRSLVIVDDFLPNILSGFRVAEFTGYLEAFPHATIRSTYGPPQTFAEKLAEFAALFPALRHRIRSAPVQEGFADNEFAFAYFLNTIYPHIEALEASNTPFAFQLSPGGGFSLGDPECDRKLARVLASPQLTYVITTQPVTSAYLKDRYSIPDHILKPVGPGVVWAADMAEIATTKARYPTTKPQVDVGFVSMKYGQNVRAKGYDFFALMADAIAQQVPHAQFHVVGDYDPTDANLGAAAQRTVFHGVLPHPALKQLYRDLDLIITPNIPFALTPWHFDGFPLGAVAEAGVAGVVPAITDPLALNQHFHDGKDILLIPRSLDCSDEHEARAASQPLVALLKDPSALAAFSARTAQRFASVYSYETQMVPRVELLRQALAGDLQPAGDWASGWRNALVGEERHRAALHAEAEQAVAYLTQKEGNIQDLLDQIKAMDAAMANGQRYLQSKETQAVEQATAIAERDARVAKAQDEIDQLTLAVRSGEALLERKQAQAQEQAAAIAERDARVAKALDEIDQLTLAVRSGQALLERKEGQIDRLLASLADRDIQDREAQADRRRELSGLHRQMEELTSVLRDAHSALNRREGVIAALTDTLTERERVHTVAEADRLVALASSKAQKEKLESHLQEAQAAIAARDTEAALLRQTHEALLQQRDELQARMAMRDEEARLLDKVMSERVSLINVLSRAPKPRK